MKLRLNRGTLASNRDERKNQEQGYGVGDDHEWRMKGEGRSLVFRGGVNTYE